MIAVTRITGPKQKAALRELQLICLPNDTPADCDRGGCAFALYHKKQMIAFGLARKSRGYKQTMYLSRAGVHPDYRGRGFQRELIALREDWARKHGLKYSITDTANSSTSSMQSLIDMGYRPYWPIQVKPWALRESVYWKKTL
jgi:GNAT superfamily N-acetyltransferase